MNPLVQPDPGLYIWTIITFLVLLALLAKFAWKPLLEALDNRQQSIRKALDDARKAQQELEGIHAESAKLLAQARSEAAEIVSRSRSDADRFREEMKDKARAAADPAGSRRPVGRHRVEDPAAERVEGRQRTPDPRDFQRARDQPKRALK